MTPNEQLLTRAVELLNTAQFSRISQATVAEYIKVADRVQALRERDGDDWYGLEHIPGAPSTLAVVRAAWTRRTHREVALALQALRSRSAPEAECMERLQSWVPEAEACRPCPGHAPTPSQMPERRPPTLSKRHSLGELPPDWLDQIWKAAVGRDFKHKDALAILIVTGCRPAEVCQGVALRITPGCLEICIAGAKTTDAYGQPWRRLSVELDGRGPVAHLAMLTVGTQDGLVRLQAECSPTALSMGVTDLGEACGMPHRISPYDIRHQRCADARTAFGGDADALAAWLGHSGTSSARYYGRLPRSAGVRGPVPVSATAARDIKHPLYKNRFALTMVSS